MRTQFLFSSYKSNALYWVLELHSYELYTHDVIKLA